MLYKAKQVTQHFSALSPFSPVAMFLLPATLTLCTECLSYVCGVSLVASPAARVCVCVCGSESLSCGPDAMSHEGREVAVPSGMGGLGGPLANGILPFLGCSVKFPAHSGNTRIWWFLALQ